jgi:hypothetical protein
MADTCATCRFWDRHEGDAASLGDCCLGPPTVSEALMRYCMPSALCSNPLDDLELTTYQCSLFPVTHQESWCGRHERPGLEISPC